MDKRVLVEEIEHFIGNRSTSALLFSQSGSLVYLCVTIALVGKVNGRFGAKRAEVTFRPFYWHQVKRISVANDLRVSKGASNAMILSLI
jgi:hypothetical protein